MTIDQKLDRIIELLEGLTKARAPATQNQNHPDFHTSQALLPVLRQLKAGRYPAHVLAAMSRLADDKPTAHSIGRVMDGLGLKRYRTNAQRGFVLSAEDVRTLSRASAESAHSAHRDE